MRKIYTATEREEAIEDLRCCVDAYWDSIVNYGAPSRDQTHFVQATYCVADSVVVMALFGKLSIQ